MVDHKPLLAILGSNQDLSELANPRLMNLKLKTNAYRFIPRYVPGKLHVVPDTMSRRLDSPVCNFPKPSRTPPLDNNVKEEYKNSFGSPSWVSKPVNVCEIEREAENMYRGCVITSLTELNIQQSAVGVAGVEMDPVITWERLNKAAASCDEYVKLREAVTSGFPMNKDQWPEEIKGFRAVHKDLTVLDQVVMLQKRVVVPKALRQEVLRHLHAGHGGISGMTQRARMSVYWPDFTVDIIRTREQCRSCSENAPSNPRMMPTQESQIPEYPFQVICMDFFQV